MSEQLQFKAQFNPRLGRLQKLAVNTVRVNVAKPPPPPAPPKK